MKPKIKETVKKIAAVLGLLFLLAFGVGLILIPFWIWDGEDVWSLIFFIIVCWMAGIPYAIASLAGLVIVSKERIKDFIQHIKQAKVPPGDA